MMHHPFPSDEFRQREQQVEHRALDMFRYPSHKARLIAYQLWVAIVVEPPGKKPLTIQGSALFEQRPLHQFMQSQAHLSDPYQLSAIEDFLAPQYQQWLVSHYTARFRYITAEAHLHWLEQVAILALRYHMLETKYLRLIREGKDTFADPNVAIALAILLGQQAAQQELPRLIHHIKEADEQARELVKLFFDEYERRLTNDLLLLPRTNLTTLLLTQQAREQQEGAASESQGVGEEDG